jgi:hypothetical protein
MRGYFYLCTGPLHSCIETADGDACALGVLGKARGIDVSGVDPECYEQVAQTFGVTEQLARQIVFMNDEF